MSRTTLRTCVAGLAMALAAGTAIPVFAATDAAPPAGESAAPAQHPGHWQHHGAKGHKPHGGPMMMWREGMMIPGLGPISKPQVEALKLDANQQALLKQAHDAQRDLFKARRDAMLKQRGLIDQQTTAGKLDPRALASAADADRDQFRGQATQVRDKWLAVWDSLNDSQRTQVGGFVKEREARMEDMHARMQEHMQEHQGHRAKPAAASAG